MSNGVVKVLSPVQRSYYKYDDVMMILGISRSKAYQMITEMQKECKSKGMLPAFYPAGRIPKKYFNQQCMIDQ